MGDFSVKPVDALKRKEQNYLAQLKQKALQGDLDAKEKYMRLLKAEQSIAVDQAKTGEMTAEANYKAAQCISVVDQVVTGGAGDDLSNALRSFHEGDAVKGSAYIGKAAFNICSSALLGSKLPGYRGPAFKPPGIGFELANRSVNAMAKSP